MKLKCKKFFGKIIKVGEGAGTHYLDQIRDDIKWISRSFIEGYLSREYDLTPQQYYNLVVYGDISFKPRCKYCSNSARWWRISNGYYLTCSSECKSKSHSESNHHR